MGFKIIQRLKCKFHDLSLSNLKKILKEHGLALLVITIVWEIIEDIVFPVIFYYLGKHINPIFYTMIPARLILCVHWLVVPFTWGLWIKIKNKKKLD